MSEELVQQPETLRETLTANLEAAEAGTLPTAEERARDEAGRFARKEETTPVAAPVAPDPVMQLRPTTWKKEYLPLWDKAAQGQPLSKDEWKKLAEYNGQRENEYKTGVSTYKAEAMQAKEIQESIAPFLNEMQIRGTTPARWIKDVGQAHYVLVKGTPEQKLQLFHALANQYGVPIAAVQQHASGQQVPPIVTQLMAKINELENKVGGVDTWKQQTEMQAIQHEIEKVSGDTVTYPHFEAVREDMAQLLEKMVAPDLPTAYKMAVRNRDDLFEQEVSQRLAAQQTTKTGVIAQAKAKAISPKSATPSGQATTATAKDRRSQLDAAYDAMMPGGRV